jgi:hypothetical protein
LTGISGRSLAMDIENREIDRLARELAAETGETLTLLVSVESRQAWPQQSSKLL